MDLMAVPNATPIKAAKDAGYKNPGVSANMLMKKIDIVSRIEKRKREAASNSFITAEVILGATVQRAFSSIDDVLDAEGNFDIEKARRTGAINMVRKLQRKQNRSGGYDIVVEMYPISDAQSELANYLGMEKAPRDDNEIYSLRKAVEQIAKAINEMPTEEDYREAWKRVKYWAMENKAKYSPEAIDVVAKEYSE